jgi:hypothetical protein
VRLSAKSGGSEELIARLRELAAGPWDGASMVAALPRVQCERGKYDEFLPESLLREAFVADQLDPAGARERLGAIISD